jgi:hypothetical protein
MVKIIAIRRKYNLAEVGKPFESVEFEVAEGTEQEMIIELDRAYKAYIKILEVGLVR